MEAAQRQPDAVTEAQTRHGCGAAAVEIPTKSHGKKLHKFTKKTQHPQQIPSIYIPLFATCRNLHVTASFFEF